MVACGALVGARAPAFEHDAIIHCVPHSGVHIGCQDSHAAIQGAVDHAEEGEIVLVGAGTYAEQVTLSQGGITLLAVAGAEDTTIDASGLDGRAGTAVTACGSLYRVEGFTLAGGSQGGAGLRVCDGGPSYVYDNRIVGGSLGIALSGTSRAIVQGNSVTATEVGVSVCCGSTDNRFESNIVEGNETGFSVSAEGARLVYNVIRGNRTFGATIGAPGDPPIDARYNYWGAPTGPGTPEADLAGPGVIFLPWCLLPDCSIMKTLVERGVLPP